MVDPLLTYVFEDVSADLFQHGNLHVLVYADKLSGRPVIHQWRRDPTAREVVQAVASNFVVTRFVGTRRENRSFRRSVV